MHGGSTHRSTPHAFGDVRIANVASPSLKGGWWSTDAGSVTDGEMSSVSADGGFTLLELLTAMTIFGILSSIAVMGLRSYQAAADESASARNVVFAFRNAAEQAQSEGRTYCVSFDTTKTWSVWRYSCDPSVAGALRVSVNNSVQGNSAFLSGITLSAPAGMVSGCPAPAVACAYFYPRGNSSSGTVSVGRTNGTKTYTVKLEGLTSRAFLP